MKILILTSYDKFDPVSDEKYQKESTFKIYDYWQKNDQKVVLARYSDLEIYLGRKTEFLINDEKLSDFDLVFFRATTDYKNGIYNGKIAETVANYCIDKNIKTINGLHLTKFSHDFNKLFQAYFLNKNKLPTPQTFYVKEEKFYSKLPSPLVRKPTQGSHGEEVAVIKNKNDFNTTGIQDDFIYQEILPNRTDYRILVFNGKCLGVIKRTAAPGQFVSNYSAGGAVEITDLSDEMINLSVKSARAFSLDFCGVDIMTDSDGALKILEVNRFPEFNGFEQATKINVAAELLKTFCLKES